jgi:hypothetical protein
MIRLQEVEKGLCPISEGYSISIPERLYERAALHCIPFSIFRGYTMLEHSIPIKSKKF